jgi:glycosyltransferase involved in cell wall biosynthesis
MNEPSENQEGSDLGSIGKVLMLSGSFPPMACGVGDSAFELAQALASKGIDISVITDKGANPVAPGDGPVPIFAEIDKWGIWSIKKLVKAVEGHKPDILHIHYPSKAYGTGLAVPFLPTLIRARRKPIKIVLTLHEFKLSHTARKNASFILLDPCDAVVAPCRLELEALFRRHVSVNEKITAAIPVGPVGPSPENFPADVRAEMRANVRKAWRLSEKDVVLFHYGTPTKSKGLETLFKALRLLKLEGETPFLFVLGDCRPAEEDFHRAMIGQTLGLGIKDQVRWLGRLPNQELPGVFSAVDIGVFPFTDGFSCRRSSLVGALMWDMPIITTEPDGDIPELSNQDKVRLVPREDPRALATALLTLTANPKALEAAKLTPNPFKELFRWERIASDYAEIYRQVSEKT